MLNNPNEWHNIEEDLENNVDENVIHANNAQSGGVLNGNTQKIKIGLAIAGVVLIIVIMAFKIAGANKTELASTPLDPMSGAYGTDVGAESTAVIDVNLSDTQDPSLAQSQNGALPIAAAPVAQGGQNPGELVIASKEMTPTDKYNFNKDLVNKTSNRGTVVVSVGGEGRENPFFPYREKKSNGLQYAGGGNINFDIIEPPATVLPDPEATKLMETTISGIMYETRNPSAIININGQDQLVRKNDKIGGYTILDITKDKVVIKSGTNIYRASVGQSIVNEEINFNEIPNLRNKFGGAYTTVNKNSINFNAY